MQWSTLRRNSLVYRTVALVTIAVFGFVTCELTPFDPDDPSGDTGDSDTLVELVISAGADASFSANAVAAESVESVYISVRKANANDPAEFAAKRIGATESFEISVMVPIETALRIEAFGYNGDGIPVASGLRETTIPQGTTPSLSLSLVRYSPGTLAIPTLSAIGTTPAVAAGGEVILSLSGSIDEDDWPVGADGAALPVVDLYTTVSVDGAEHQTFHESIPYATGERVSFSDLSVTAPAGTDGPSAAVDLRLELVPGGTYLQNVTLPRIHALSGATASGSDNTVDLSWSNPSDGAFSAVAVTMNGTGIYDGTGTSLTRSALTNNALYTFILTPYYESDGIRVTGPSSTVRATPVDTVAPPAASGFSAVTSTGSGSITLNWTNPADDDLQYVMVRRDTSGYPSSVTGGIQVAYRTVTSGAVDSISDAVSATDTYYYTLWTRDNDSNWGAAVHAAVAYSAGIGGTRIYDNTYTVGYLSSSDGYSVGRLARSSRYAYTDVYYFYNNATGSSTGPEFIGLDGYYGSPDFDTYLYLYAGTEPDIANLITYNDDSGYNGYGLNSQISRTLDPGWYCVEVTSYGTRATGQYRLYVNF